MSHIPKNSSTANNNYMSTIQTNIKNNFNSFKYLLNCGCSEGAKAEFDAHIKRNTNLEEIQYTLIDKTILSLINRRKLVYKNYRFLFYLFFKRENFRLYTIRFHHKNFGKFFKKFFTSECDRAFSEFDIPYFINFYIIELYKLISNEKFEESNDNKTIENLKDAQILPLEKLDSVDLKYMKTLVKYILAFLNIFENVKNDSSYHIIIYRNFSVIEDKIFNEYFTKQLYKIYINKGIYKNGKAFILNLFSPLIYQDNKLSQLLFNFLTYNLINSVLSYRPKFCINKDEDNSLYEKSSPFYFLNIVILIKIMRKLSVKDKLLQKMLFKFTDAFNNRINLFIDDDNKLRVAELLLTDTINNKIIINHLDKMELIKPYLQNNNNIQNKKYFEYLFYDLSIDKYVLAYYNNRSKENNIKSTTNISSNNNSLSNNSFECDNSLDDIKLEKFKLDDKINEKFRNFDDEIIQKYFNKNDPSKNMRDILSNNNLEELFVILDLIYYISNKFFDEDIVKKSIDDIRIIIELILTKSFEEKKFNCTIYNFMIMIDYKYLPLQKDFDIILCNHKILEKESYSEFIKTYPLYIIFILNFCVRKKYDIMEFLKYIKSYIIGYLYVFNSIDQKEDGYSHTLQLNYLCLLYYIIKQFLFLMLGNKNNTSNNIEHLPYCTMCKKKCNNPIILSKYLSQCFYCGYKHLYINSNVLSYLFEHENEVKEFANEIIFDTISKLTLIILCKFKEKYDKKDETSMFGYHLYYKIMNEHFQFLNYIQVITDKNIPFAKEQNNNRSIEDDINYIFENCITDKSMYPFEAIYKTIEDDKFSLFNFYRKTIKHESKLALNKYVKI